MPPAEPWAVVVLAAGRGRRMGGPKALMPTPGGPWWRVQESRLAAAALPRTWVVSPEVAAALPAASVRAIVGDPDAPMFRSVVAGVRGVPAAPGVFILPVDVPAPRPEVFAALARSAGAGASVPVHAGRRGHPAALSRPWIDSVLLPAAAAGGDLRLDALLAHGVTEVPVIDPAVAADLNTPEDLAAWLSLPPDP